jgi:hypothetical protein
MSEISSEERSSTRPCPLSTATHAWRLRDSAAASVSRWGEQGDPEAADKGALDWTRQRSDNLCDNNLILRAGKKKEKKKHCEVDVSVELSSAYRVV